MATVDGSKLGPGHDVIAVNIMAGAAAAFTVDVLVYPLDTLKTRSQSRDFVVKAATSGQQKIALRGLYQGIGSVILATLPAAGVFFSTYESAKFAFPRHVLPLPEPVIHSAASGVAELASCLVLAPAEVVKQNAQMVRSDVARKNGNVSTSLLAFHRLTKSGTAGRLFSGYTALVARNLPFTALQFPLFEHIRTRLWRYRSKAKNVDDHRDNRGLSETGLVAGTSAASAGGLAAFLTTPSDVVKTRMMVQIDSEEGSERRMKETKIKKAPWEVTRLIYKQRGVRGFFRGGLFRSVGTAVGSGLYLGTYDTAKLFLERGSHS